MALSDREKKVLAEMERELFGASTIDPSLPAANSTPKIVAGLAIAVAGLSVVLFGAISGLILFGVAGFAVTLFGVLMASANRSTDPRGKAGRSGGKPKSPNRSSGTYFSDRWDKRQQG